MGHLAADHDEIEAKLLAADEGTLRAIAEVATLGRFRFERRQSARLRSTYLDTADRCLLSRRIALRVRSDDGDAAGSGEMTAKWGGSVEDHVHSRRELTVDLPERRIPTALPPGPLRDALSSVVGDRRLETLFVTDIHRRTALIRDAAGSVVAELALDTVRHSEPSSARTGAPYHEVEIEHVGSGSTAVVAEIAALLRSRFQLQPTADSKFSRALRDLHGLTMPPTPANSEA